MTISTQTASVTYTGNGVQTAFTYNFLIPYQSDDTTPAVAVYVIEDDVVTLIPSDQYTITGVDDSDGGTVTYPLSGSPLSSSQQIQISRALAYTQPTPFPNQGFLPEVVEESLDDIVMMIQQLASALGVTTTVQPQQEAFPFACTDETTEITATGVYVTFQFPYAFNIESLYASLTTASDGGDVSIAVNVNGVDILSTDITIEEGETSSLTATTQPVVSSPSLAAADVVTLEVLTAGASATGLKVVLVGRQP